MACQRCKSEKILKIVAKCSDMFNAIHSDGREYEGYIPSDLGIGGSDYLDFDYCLDCGQIQEEFPIEPNFSKWS